MPREMVEGDIIPTGWSWFRLSNIVDVALQDASTKIWENGTSYFIYDDTQLLATMRRQGLTIERINDVVIKEKTHG